MIDRRGNQLGKVLDRNFRGHAQKRACVYYEREKAESEAQRGKPKGTLESEIRIAMLLLGQRPPRYTGVGRS